MFLDEVWQLSRRRYFEDDSGADLFNPYHDHAPAFDRPDAVAIRRDNLRRYLAAYDAAPPVLLVAEAPGPWGCRYTGVPITSEAQLADPAFPLTGRSSSRRDEPHEEYSASIFWRVMQPYFPHFLVWNSVPYHPFKPGEPHSIRAPRRSEIKAFTASLAALVDVLKPERCVAVGRKAEYALAQAGRDATYVRHPSQGGATRFEEGVTEVFEAMGLAPGR